MTWFVESPWPALVLGIGLEVVLAIMLVRTGRAAIIVGMVFVLALTAGMMLLERVIVTEREEVETTLDGIADALVANDSTAVLALISPLCTQRGQVKSSLSHVKISEAKIGGDLNIRVNGFTSPPSAIATFTGRLQVTDTRGPIPYEHFISKFKVTLHKEADRWLVFDYTDVDPRDRSGGSSRAGQPVR